MNKEIYKNNQYIEEKKSDICNYFNINKEIIDKKIYVIENLKEKANIKENSDYTYQFFNEDVIYIYNDIIYIISPSLLECDNWLKDTLKNGNVIDYFIIPAFLIKVIEQISNNVEEILNSYKWFFNAIVSIFTEPWQVGQTSAIVSKEELFMSENLEKNSYSYFFGKFLKETNKVIISYIKNPKKLNQNIDNLLNEYIEWFNKKRTNEFNYYFETKNIMFRSTTNLKKQFSELINVIDIKTEDINNFFDIKKLDKKLEVLICKKERFKRDVNNYRLDYQDWLIGCQIMSGNLVLLLDYNDVVKTKSHANKTKKGYIDTILHEYVHFIQNIVANNKIIIEH